MNRRAALLLATLTLTACKHSTAPTETPAGTAQPSTPPAPAVDPATASSLTGKITLTGKPPAPIAIDMSADPACALAPGQNLTEQYAVDKKGGLGNVFVYIKAGLPASSAPAGTPAVVLDQKGCRYLPHVIALQQGGTVEFHNSDPTMHNIHTLPANAANAATDISQTPMGPPQTQQFKFPETMLPVRCNNHPWMNAFLNIAPNPYFAITAPDGSFTLPNLPPGTYTLAAVHEKLGEQDLPITVPPKSTTNASFTFAAK